MRSLKRLQYLENQAILTYGASLHFLSFKIQIVIFFWIEFKYL